jgi:hypothetical protein
VAVHGCLCRVEAAVYAPRKRSPRGRRPRRARHDGGRPQHPTEFASTFDTAVLRRPPSGGELASQSSRAPARAPLTSRGRSYRSRSPTPSACTTSRSARAMSPGPVQCSGGCAALRASDAPDPGRSAARSRGRLPTPRLPRARTRCASLMRLTPDDLRVRAKDLATAAEPAEVGFGAADGGFLRQAAVTDPGRALRQHQREVPSIPDPGAELREHGGGTERLTASMRTMIRRAAAGPCRAAREPRAERALPRNVRRKSRADAPRCHAVAAGDAHAARARAAPDRPVRCSCQNGLTRP